VRVRRAFIVGCIRRPSVFTISEGGLGVFFSIVADVIFGKPNVGPGLEGANLLRSPVSIQLVSQQLLKERVIAEPSVFDVQGDQEKVVHSEPGDKLVAIHLARTRPGAQLKQRIAQRRTELIQGCRCAAISFAISGGCRDSTSVTR